VGQASGRVGLARGAILTAGLVVWASKPPDAMMTDFAAFGP
jgi:hypothetical protein